MESPVLQSSASVQIEENKKMKLALALLLFILAVGFLLIVVFTYGKSSAKSPEPTFNDEENAPVVSAPGIAVGEPNPNTPIPVESELTYTFPAAHGFNITYTASDWTVTKEPTEIHDYTPQQPFGTEGNSELRLQSTKDPASIINVYFVKANSGILTGNPLIECSTVYSIIKPQSSTGAIDGLIRFDQQDNGTLIYANSYFDCQTESGIGIYNSHPIYKYEKVPGGENPSAPDSNDIYWISSVYTTKANTQLGDTDKIVSTIKFAE